MADQTTAPPSKAEVIAFLQEQIEVKKVQLELQTLNADLADAKAREVRALGLIGQMTAPKQEDTVQHKVTQEDIDNNPEMVEAGIKVGDEILVPKNSFPEQK